MTNEEMLKKILKGQEELQQVLTEARYDLKQVQKDQLKNGKDISFIKKIISMMIGKFDERINKNERRIERIEDHLNLPYSSKH